MVLVTLLVELWRHDGFPERRSVRLASGTRVVAMSGGGGRRRLTVLHIFSIILFLAQED